MSFDITALKLLAANSGRDSYITDERFGLLWSNTDTELVEVLLNANSEMFRKYPNKEVLMNCPDGALKAAPIIENGAVIGYFFEKYKKEELFDMLSFTSFFNEFTQQYDFLRTAMTQMITELFGKDKELQTNERFRELISSTAGAASLMEMLSDKKTPNVIDLYVSTVYCCSFIKDLAKQRGQYVFECHTDQGLYVRTNRAFYEYALTELLLFSYISVLPDDSGECIVNVNTYCDNKVSIVTEIKCTSSLIGDNKIKELTDPIGDAVNNIPLVKMFADKYYGSFTLSQDENGELSMVLKLPYNQPENHLSLMSSEKEDEPKYLKDLMGRYFTDDEIYRAEKNREAIKAPKKDPEF